MICKRYMLNLAAHVCVHGVSPEDYRETYGGRLREEYSSERLVKMSIAAREKWKDSAFRERQKKSHRHAPTEEMRKIMLEVWQRPGYRKKCVKSHLGKPTWNKGLTKETDERVRRHAQAVSKANSNMSEEGRNNIRMARIKTAFPHTNTSIEVKVQNILRDNYIVFVTHYPFYRDGQGTQIDIALPEEKIAVYVDGCFWHSCPFCMTKTYYCKTQINNILADAKNEALLFGNGWRILRVWEHTVKVTPERIVEALNTVREGGGIYVRV